jgi:hypothetical protein
MCCSYYSGNRGVAAKWLSTSSLTGFLRFGGDLVPAGLALLTACGGACCLFTGEASKVGDGENFSARVRVVSSLIVGSSWISTGSSSSSSSLVPSP